MFVKEKIAKESFKINICSGYTTLEIVIVGSYKSITTKVVQKNLPYFILDFCQK